MPIKGLLENIGKQNIAGDIGKDELDQLGERVKRQFDEDWGSMQAWMESVDHSPACLLRHVAEALAEFAGIRQCESPHRSGAEQCYANAVQRCFKAQRQ